MGLLISLVREIRSFIQWRHFTKRGAKLLAKYQQDSNPADLTEAVDNYQNALALCPPEHPNRSTSLNNLIIATWTRYLHQRDLDDLTGVILYQQEWLDIHPHGDPNRRDMVASTILIRYEREGNSADLTRAAQYYREALDLRPPGHPDRPDSLNKVASAVMERYEVEGSPGDLIRAIQYYQEALDLRPPGHPGRSGSLNQLANALQTRYERDGNLEDLVHAIQYHEEALNLRSPGHPDRSDSLSSLANAIWTRYKRDGDSEDLTQAIQYHEEALNLRPPGHPSRSASLNNLGTVIWTRYNRDGNLVDLTHAIQYHEEALNLRPPGHPNRSSSLNNLANAVQTRYKWEGNLADLTRAIQYNQEALTLRPPGHPGRSDSLNNLGGAIMEWYKREGNLDDLTRAIQYNQEALNLRPPGHPGRSSSLNNMANAIQTRYERDGNLDDFTLTMQYYQEALDLHPPGHPDRSASLSNLASAIWTRYKRDRNLADLTCAIQYYQEALNLCPPGHPGRSISLDNLANAIHNRYQREGNLDDLTRAIHYNEEALELCPPRHPGRSASLNNLADAIWSRYNSGGNLDDLALIIEYYQEALDLHPPGHHDRSASLSNLANAIQIRYEREGNSNDLTCAIEYHREALDLCPVRHPRRSDCLRYLAKALYTEYSRSGSVGHSVSPSSLNPRADTFEPPEHVDRPSPECDLPDSSRRRIISLLREASQSPNCSPRDCFRSALNWVIISKDLNAPDSTLEAYRSALDQLDLALAIAQSLNQRHNRLFSDEMFANTKDLSVNAATWAVQHDDLPQAVELLEQGRSLLLAQIGRYRVEVDDLRLTDPELANRFTRLSRLLDASIVSNQALEESSSTIRDPYERYRKVSTEWTRTVEEIRALRSFEAFLKPTPYEKLRQAAAEGPVIVLIPHKEGSVALIVLSDAPIHHIDLPQATSNRLSELSNIFTHALNYKDYNDAQRERECVDNLASLWNEVVGPVAQVLQHDLAIPLRSRVWWCPISAACFLPLHAAGLYAKGKTGENFLDKYISSYTTTLQALLRARRSSSTAPKGLLVISQPHTPGEPPLPYAQDEAEKIGKIVSPNGAEPPTTMTSLASEAGTCEAVQREITSHPWIHFICHGVQAANHPLDSYLSLHDGHLTLHKIIEQNLPNADFAFLAACHSAAGDKDLANEALHLAAAMQFAGFRGVVGTLWKMRDVDGPLLAEAFYKDMVKRGDHRRAAVALSKAINHLRRSKVPIHCWMRFIHIGA